MGDSHEQMYCLWDAGQRHLAGLRYVAARTALEAAEAAAWRARDARALGRIYLPLLETRRQIRYQAAEGVVVICDSVMKAERSAATLREFLKEPAGTILLPCPATAAGKQAGCLFAGSVQYEAAPRGAMAGGASADRACRGEARGDNCGMRTSRRGCELFGLGNLLPRLARRRITSWSYPCRRLGVIRTGALHAIARESLIVGWEALALKWQRRHGPGRVAHGRNWPGSDWRCASIPRVSRSQCD